MSGAPQEIFDLSGRVCVVTGGGRGVGSSISRCLAAAGAEVVLTGRTMATLEATASGIAATGGKAHPMAADVSVEADVIALAAEVECRFGAPHVLVNNAGVNAVYKPLDTITLAEWNEIIGINLTGVFLATREFGRTMLAAGRGSVINITSIAGHVGLARTGPYCASKGGVELFTKSVAIDWAKKGVRVNAVAPAYVETDLTSGLRQHPVLAERLTGRTPMGRFAAPDEICGAVLFLASDASSYVTGQSIGVDGGWTAA